MKPWTVLVYLAGDNGRFLSSLEGEGVADLMEMKDVGSGEAVNVVAQFDAMTDRACRRYAITRGGRLADDMVQDLGDTNSGDARVLLDFVTWGVCSYPAERYLLILWNHGSGWKDDDIYAPYRSLVRRGDLPLVAPEIGGRRVSRALFRRSLEAVVEEEVNQVLLANAARRQGASPAGLRAAGTLPAAWTRPASALPPSVRGEQGGAAREVMALRGSRPPHARAVCFDDSSKDFLDGRDLTELLNAAATVIGKKVDVLGFDACLMSMIEIAYQVRDGASVMVASEDAEPGSGWPYRDILTALTANPALPAADLGKTIVEQYVSSYDRTLLTSLPVTQSALNLERVTSVVAALDDLARGLLNGWRQKGMRSALAEARSQAQGFMDPDYVDLFDFVSLLARKTNARAVGDGCERLLAAVDPCKVGSLVLADAHAGLTERHAHGLSIYFPRVGVSPFYAALDMSRDCAWAQFLEMYLG